MTYIVELNTQPEHDTHANVMIFRTQLISDLYQRSVPHVIWCLFSFSCSIHDKWFYRINLLKTCDFT